MPNYRWSICEPDSPSIIEKGLISKESIMENFQQFPWMDKLQKQISMKEEDVCFSPSLEFESLDTKQGVTFSILGDSANNYEFYIFYKRAKTIKSFFGFSKKHVENHISDITGQTMEDATSFLKAFLDADVEYIEAKMKDPPFIIIMSDRIFY